MASWNEILDKIIGALQLRNRPTNYTGVNILNPEAMSQEQLASAYGDEGRAAQHPDLPRQPQGPVDRLNHTYDQSAKYGGIMPPQIPAPQDPHPSLAGLTPPSGMQDNQFDQDRRRLPQVSLENAMSEYDRWQNMAPEEMDQKKDSVWKNMGKQLLLGTRDLANIPPNMQSKEELGFAVGQMAARALKGIVAPMADEQEIIDIRRQEALKKVAQAQSMYDLDIQNRTKEEQINWSQARQEKAYAEMEKLKADSAAKLEQGRVAQGKLALEVYKNRDVFNPATNTDDASIAASYRQNTGSILPVKEGKLKFAPNTFSKNGKMYTELAYVDASKGDGGVVRGYVREDGTLTQNESEAANWKDVRVQAAEISAGARVYEADNRKFVDLQRIAADLAKAKASNRLEYTNVINGIQMLRGSKHLDGTPVTDQEVDDMLARYKAGNPELANEQ